MDCCAGRMSIASQGYFYFIVFVDDATRVYRVYLMRKKSEALEKFKQYRTDMLDPLNLKPGALRSYNGSEFLTETSALQYELSHFAVTQLVL